MELTRGQGLGCRVDLLSLQATTLLICLAVCTPLESDRSLGWHDPVGKAPGDRGAGDGVWTWLSCE